MNMSSISELEHLVISNLDNVSRLQLHRNAGLDALTIEQCADSAVLISDIHASFRADHRGVVPRNAGVF